VIPGARDFAPARTSPVGQEPMEAAPTMTQTSRPRALRGAPGRRLRGRRGSPGSCDQGRADVIGGWLDGELTAVRGELGRVDGKCGVLTAIATGAAAFSVTQTGHGPVAARAVLAAAGVVFAAAVLVLLAALRPRFGAAGWCRYLSLPAEAISDLDRDGRAGTHPAPVLRARDLAAEDLRVLSRLAHAKYGRVRLAVDLVGAGVFLLGAGVVTGVIA
jgi:hypothetical protein